MKETSPTRTDNDLRARQRAKGRNAPDSLGPDATFGGRLWYDSMKMVVRLGLVLAFRIRYTGTENIPLEGGVLVTANHQSNLDPPLVGSGFPRRMSFLARVGLFQFPPFAWLIRSLNAIPLDVENAAVTGMKETLRRLKRGEVVLIFPEGSRSFDGEIAPFRPGFAALAVRSRAAVLPVTIEGAFDAWPRTRSYPLPRTIHVHFSPPLLPDQMKGFSEEELVAQVESTVRQAQAMIRQRPVFAENSKQAVRPAQL